ncbi:MAG: hypothetical protein ACI91T_003212 [Natronomonas sp.]
MWIKYNTISDTNVPAARTVEYVPNVLASVNFSPDRERGTVNRNVGTLDRTARIAAGATLVGTGVATGPTAPVRSAAAVGVDGTSLAPGSSGRCPPDEVAGVDTTEG